MLNNRQYFPHFMYPIYYPYPGFILPPLSPPTQFSSQTSQLIQSPKKKYNVINDEKRELLIKLIEEDHYTIKQASQQLEIKLSTSKAIIKIFKNQGRIAKVKQRKKRTINKKSIKIKQPDPIEQLRKQLPKLNPETIPYLNPNITFNTANIRLE